MSTGIARTRSNTYFTSVRDCFFDTANPPNTAWSILRSNSYMVDDVRPDITQPTLQYFSYDVDAGMSLLSVVCLPLVSHAFEHRLDKTVLLSLLLV